MTTADQFSDTPGTRPGTASTAVQRVEVLASTRSPVLKTGPSPATSWRTVRRTMSPSSLIHRRFQTSPAKATRVAPNTSRFHSAGPVVARGSAAPRSATESASRTELIVSSPGWSAAVPPPSSRGAVAAPQPGSGRGAGRAAAGDTGRTT